MVDAERLHRLLRRVVENVARLRRYQVVDAEDIVADEVRLGHCKHLFITAIAGAIDAAQHLCATEGYGPRTPPRTRCASSAGSTTSTITSMPSRP